MKILAIGSHPDDIEFGCGGTLCKLSRNGHKINILVMTKGHHGGDERIREKEQEKSAKMLNAKLIWGGFTDTQIPIVKSTINLIEHHIKEIQPDIIFVPFREDTHQDHRAVSRATLTATRYIKNVLFYEGPTTVNFSPASVFVDIGSVFNNKLKLLKAHKSQVFATRIADLSILESVHATAVFRGLQNRVKFAESFVPLRMQVFL
ncbi:MAG: PIG-L family deacetylase [Elusimicrobia bacterium]|nr:PIG-L family deacetylase [Candidatus Liberimonas magnetica]